jgi:formate dehydrogenase subunit delta
MSGAQTPEKLAHKANLIARFFAAQPQVDAVAATADHFKKFWEPRMRAQMWAWIDAGGGATLAPLAREAFERLRASG